VLFCVHIGFRTNFVFEKINTRQIICDVSRLCRCCRRRASTAKRVDLGGEVYKIIRQRTILYTSPPKTSTL